jgi:hypothetical protein
VAPLAQQSGPIFLCGGEPQRQLRTVAGINAFEVGTPKPLSLSFFSILTLAPRRLRCFSFGQAQRGLGLVTRPRRQVV